MKTIRPTVQIVIPVYNEGHKTEQVVAAIEAALSISQMDYAILIVNDGSTDWTQEIEQTLMAHESVEIKSSPMNRGKGAVLDEILPCIDRAYTVVIDADNEYDAQDIVPVLKPLLDGHADYVMGSRYGQRLSRPPQYAMTYLANRFFNWLFNLLSGERFSDLLTGLFAFKSDLVRDLHLQQARFAYVPELVWRIQNTKHPRWKDVPISYRFRRYAEGKKIQWWEFFTVTLAIINYRKAEH